LKFDYIEVVGRTAWYCVVLFGSYYGRKAKCKWSGQVGSGTTARRFDQRELFRVSVGARSWVSCD
ncbi:hypothetical protein CRG98_002775, partial [Punica granatum]